MNKGFFGIGILNCKTETNYGTLFRTATILGSSYLFLIGKRFKRQSSDTVKSHKTIPIFEYKSFDDFYQYLPYDCRLIGIELTDNAIPIENYMHPIRACYLLGAEDHGLTSEAIDKCNEIVRLKGLISLNVAVAGSIVLHSRATQEYFKK